MIRDNCRRFLTTAPVNDDGALPRDHELAQGFVPEALPHHAVCF